MNFGIKNMEFISTKDLTNENAPEGQVLVQYLEPSWGGYSVEYSIGYFDNPNDYEDSEDGEGWKLWHNGKDINVISYAILPETSESELSSISQKDFEHKYRSFHPELGNAGKLTI